MRLLTRLSVVLTAFLALAPPATATDPPNMVAKNTRSSIEPQQQYIGAPAITDVAITRTDQELVLIGDFYLGANTQNDIGNTKIGSSPPATADANIGPPDKVEASPTAIYVTNATKNNAIDATLGRSSSAAADDDAVYGEPATNSPEYNLLCRQSAGPEHK